MCCIIHRTLNSKAIPDSDLEKIIKINPDGWGISYFKAGKLEVIRSLEMHKAISKIKDLEEENIEFLFHARYATHGDKSLENCHPYDVKNGVLFHNGKIDVFCRNKKFSDTYYFSLKVNKYLRKNKSLDWITNKFKSSIGQSRLAFMTNEGKIIKFGQWYVIDGSFYSKLNWQDDYYMYYGYSDYTGSAKKSQTLLNTSLVDSFEEVVENCVKGICPYGYLLKKLNITELISLAIEFPELCAHYLNRQITR